jgi:tetratricopeptide (TPR) repeat protein
MASEPFRVQLKPLSLYLGELFRLSINENVLDLDYEEGNAYCCYWPAGVLYLWSVINSIPRMPFLPERLLLIGFGVPFVFFLLLPGGERFDPFWWASSSLISAIALAGSALDRWTRRSPVVLVIVLLFLAWLLGHYLPLAIRPGGPGGEGYPRTTVERLSENAIRDARDALLEGNTAQARRSLIYALNVGGENAEAFYLLAHASLMSGNYDAAESYIQKCLDLEPGHPAAETLLEEIRNRKQTSRPKR